MGKRSGNADCHPDKTAVGRKMCRLCYDRWWRAEVKGLPSRTLPEVLAKREEIKNSLDRSDMQHHGVLQRYGLTGQEYWQMFDQQGGSCAVCGNPETAKRKNGSVQRLAVDHDHETGTVRGLLCYRCNMMIGFGQDSKDILLSAAIYLERTALDA